MLPLESGRRATDRLPPLLLDLRRFNSRLHAVWTKPDVPQQKGAAKPCASKLRSYRVNGERVTLTCVFIQLDESHYLVFAGAADNAFWHTPK
jgi:hypothetical protein